MTIDRRDRLLELFGAVRDGAASEAQLDELNAALAGDDQATAMYGRFMRLHAALLRHRRDEPVSDGAADGAAEPEDVAEAVVIATIGDRRRAGLAWAVAAALAIAGGAAALVVSMMGDRGAGVGPTVRAAPVAVIGDVSGAVWGSEPMEPGADVEPQVVRLEAGRVSIEFHGGASVDVVGPAEFAVTGSNRATLRRGRIDALGTPGFAVDLPGGARVTDLGTAFGVMTDEGAGGSVSSIEVWVTQGRVRLDTGAAGAAGVAGEAGEAIVIAAPSAMRVAGGRAEPIALDPVRHMGWPASLVAVWRFDDAERFTSGVGRTTIELTATGDAAYTADGRDGGGLLLDGDGDALIARAFPVGVPVGSAAYTVAAWVKATADGSRGIIGWGDYGGGDDRRDYALKVNALRLLEGGGLRHYWWGRDIDLPGEAIVGRASAADRSIGLVGTGWRHVAVTFDGVTRTIWVDGAAMIADTPGSPDVAPINLAIGRTSPYLSPNDRPGGGEYFAGVLDDVAIFDAALDAAQLNKVISGSPGDAR